MRKLIVITIIFLICLSVGYVYFKVTKSDNAFKSRKFDEVLLLKYANSKEPKNPRGEMYYDLEKNYLYEGMDKTAVIELLGQPDSSLSTNEIFSYNLGTWSGYRIDFDT